MDGISILLLLYVVQDGTRYLVGTIIGLIISVLTEVNNLLSILQMYLCCKTNKHNACTNK